MIVVTFKGQKIIEKYEKEKHTFTYLFVT